MRSGNKTGRSDDWRIRTGGIVRAAVIPPLMAAMTLSCNTTRQCDPCPNRHEKATPATDAESAKAPAAGERIFPSLYDTLKQWPGLNAGEYRDLTADIAAQKAPTSAALYETMGKDGYIYISHVGRHVAIAFLNQDLRVRDVKSFTSNLGFSTCWKQGLILTLHRHPATGSFVDTKVFVNTEGSSINLQYEIE
jgi:hypothetical protein